MSGGDFGAGLVSLCFQVCVHGVFLSAEEGVVWIDLDTENAGPGNQYSVGTVQLWEKSKS